MADPITKMFLSIKTANIANAGTDGNVYIGVGGREFRCETEADNFESGATDKFWFGATPTVNRPENNDPRAPQLTVEDAYRFPMYIRFSQVGDTSEWCLESATLFINLDAAGPRPIFWCKPEILWLGNSAGMVCYMIERNLDHPHLDDMEILAQLNLPH